MAQSGITWCSMLQFEFYRETDECEQQYTANQIILDFRKLNFTPNIECLEVYIQLI